jgi:hypothetical protein
MFGLCVIGSGLRFPGFAWFSASCVIESSKNLTAIRYLPSLFVCTMVKVGAEMLFKNPIFGNWNIKNGKQ